MPDMDLEFPRFRTSYLSVSWEKFCGLLIDDWDGYVYWLRAENLIRPDQPSRHVMGAVAMLPSSLVESSFLIV